MKILEDKIKKETLLEMSENVFNDEMIKAVVDVKKELVGIDAEMHADIEQYMLEKGSAQEDLWGINLYPEEDGGDFIEYDSMINVRPRQNNRSRYVEDGEIRKQIAEIVSKWCR